MVEAKVVEVLNSAHKRAEVFMARNECGKLQGRRGSGQDRGNLGPTWARALLIYEQRSGGMGTV